MISMLAVALLATTAPQAQTTSVEPTQATVFFSGSWATDASNPVTAVSAGLTNSDLKRIFHLSSTYMLDNIRPAHVPVTERGESKAPFFEGSGALAEAINLEIKQVGPGSSLMGVWKVVAPAQPDPSSFTQIQWQAQTDRIYQIADWEKPRLIVLEFQKHPTASCTGKMTAIVDGKVIKLRSGAEAKFLPGSSILTRGATVALKIDGACNVPETPGNLPAFFGTLKALNAPS